MTTTPDELVTAEVSEESPTDPIAEPKPTEPVPPEFSKAAAKMPDKYRLLTQEEKKKEFDDYVQQFKEKEVARDAGEATS